MRKRPKKNQVFSYGDTKYQKFRNIDTRPFITHKGNPKDKRRSYRNNRNSILPLLVCIAVCFFVIDGSIYAYFKFIRKQPVIEGLKEMRSSTQKFLYSKTEKVTPAAEQKVKKAKWTPVAPYQYEEKIEKPIRTIAKGNGNVFTWRDENGNVHASNVEVPHDHQINNLTIQKEVNTWEKETPIKIEGNRLLIPVVLGHQGKAIRSTILIDTGCTRTMLSKWEMSKIRGEYIREATSRVADGRKVTGEHRRVDYIQVGPFIERNMVVTSQKIIGSDKTGLLGMDFLKKHPFTIDSNRKVIVWQ